MRSLELVDFVDSKDRPLDGLVPVRDPASADGPHERAILLQAASFEHIDFVFFRRFKDAEGKVARSSQVAAYVIDNSRQKLTEDNLADLHHKLWLHGVAPLIYVAWPTRVDVLSCARKPDFWDARETEAAIRYRPAAKVCATNESPRQSLATAANISDELAKRRRRFSAYRLAEGTFWDDPENQKLAKDDAAAHRSLIQAIVEADKELDGANKPLRRRLLVLTVLIKYLEDRGVFPAGLFGRFHAGARSFRDILRKGTAEEVTRLLRYFETKFNGDVFSLGDDGQELTQAELRRFARLVEAKTLGGQRHFWELFSFAHIPVEVISRLYQRFVMGHGAVYTPPFLAALLLDQVMPYDTMTGKERVLDPACGSGIFLVGAFKRLVIRWRSRHRWQKPTVEDLKELLARSIYGVELEPGAVDLTAFSLALAVCDALEPPVIWSSLKLDKLRGRNLREGDFFDTPTLADVDHAWPTTFDVVVGNPPFESKLTPAAKAVDKARPKGQPRLPDNQVAYLFLEQCLRLLSPRGVLCLIQPHGLLYNSNPAAFRQHLMRIARLDSVLDFVSMRGMYEGADPKTIAWHAVQEPATGQVVNHLTFRRTYSASERITLEIDHYDWHVISQQQALENPFVWRIGLLGGGRLQELSERIRGLKTLSDLIADKEWEFGEGFIAGSGGMRAPHLTGQPFLPTETLTEDGIDIAAIRPLSEERFYRPSVPERFAPPLVLIKEHASLPVAFWDRSTLAYRDKIVGIHAPPEERNELVAVFETLQDRKRFYQFCCTVNGSQALVGKATAILKQDIDRLPMPDDPADLGLAFWEDALKEDVLNHMTDFVRLGQDSELLKNAANEDDVREYSSLYVRMLGSLYRNLRAAGTVRLNGLIAQPFYFGDTPDVSWLGDDCEETLHRLVYEQSRESLRTVRVVRFYDGNVILIVKPDRLRYWIRSTAIRDADDTLIDLREQGW